MTTFFTYLGYGTAAWIGVGLIVGIGMVITHLAHFFMAGWRWRAMLETIAFQILVWPLALIGLATSRKEEKREAALAEAVSRSNSRMMRTRHRYGDWYVDLEGIHRKLHPDGYDPNGVPMDDRIREPDFPCRNGEWKDGPCPLCGAPELGRSECGMFPADTIEAPQFSVQPRPIHDAPRDRFILAVSGKPDEHEAEMVVVRFDPSGPVWLDQRGRQEESLYGWWPLPTMDGTQMIMGGVDAGDDNLAHTWEQGRKPKRERAQRIE